MKNNVSFVFPGQGSQRVGMLTDAFNQYPIVKQLFDEASTVLHYDLWKIVSEGPVEILNQTIYTQPAMLVADIALWKIWLEKGGFKPLLIAGHSLGEYAALVAAEAITFSDAVQLVSQRAQFMQEMVISNAGAMAAIIGLDSADIEIICRQASSYGVVEPVNFNSPKQIVIAGQVAAVDEAMKLAKAHQARLVKKLDVSVPSHCSLMEPASEKLAVYLKTISMNTPKISIVNNVDATVYREPAKIADALIRQLYRPVRWIDVMEYMMFHHKINIVVECGPGKILTGLNKAINANLKLITFDDINTMIELLR